MAYNKDNKNFSIKEVLSQILNNYQNIITKFVTNPNDLLQKLNNSHPLYTKKVHILHKGKNLNGTFMGFTENGELLIHTNGYKMYFDKNTRIFPIETNP